MEEAVIQKHVTYILSLETSTRTTSALYFTDHKRLSGVYWAVTSLHLLNRLDALPKQRIVDYVMSCYSETEAMFSGNTNQDAHILYTLSALQILAIYNCLQLVDGQAVAHAIAALQRSDGAFAGDKWGEIDSRYSYCAIQSLKLLGLLSVINVEKAVNYVLKCRNFDGGFGCTPGAESHAGQIFCCIGALHMTGQLGNEGQARWDGLGKWLCERQQDGGGLNGRPDKMVDVCYSWWVLASLQMIGRADWIDGQALGGFIRRCEEEEGGIADRPGDVADVFHTFFGLAGLSLLGDEGLGKIDAAYALPVEVVERVCS